MSVTSITPPPIFPTSILLSSTSVCPDWAISAGRYAGIERLCRAVGGDGLCPSAPPRYFGEIMANLLFWLGPDKLLFGSDYAI
jgi:hypothetical protein